jgi:TIGR03009 family protein
MPTLGLTLAALLIDPQLAIHLAGWEKQTRALTNFQAEFTVTRKDAVFKMERRYTGTLLGLTSGSSRLRFENVADKADYEAYICNGQVLYTYNGLEKSITAFKLPAPEVGRPEGEKKKPLPGPAPIKPEGNRLLDFLAHRLFVTEPPAEHFPFRLVSGATAKEAGTRFEVSLFKQDEHYVYFDLRPRLPKDRVMERARVVLYGPGVKPPYVPYTPASLYVVMANGDTETWKFTGVKVNLPNVDEKAFQFEEVPGFSLKKVPAPVPPDGESRP